MKKHIRVPFKKTKKKHIRVLKNVLKFIESPLIVERGSANTLLWQNKTKSTFEMLVVNEMSCWPTWRLL